MRKNESFPHFPLFYVMMVSGENLLAYPLMN